MNTGTELTDRLLKNIQTSLELRSRIPYLEMLKELAEGGLSISKDTVNTSSNFGSFDTALREVLVKLNHIDPTFMPAPTVSPLPLTAIYENFSRNMPLLIDVLNQPVSSGIVDRLETINLAAV